DRGHLRIVEAILRLPLELRFLDEDAEDADEPLAQIVARERDALRREIVRVDEIADGLAEAATEARLVRAAARRRDAVDVAAHVLVSGFGPAQHHVEPHA